MKEFTYMSEKFVFAFYERAAVSIGKLRPVITGYTKDEKCTSLSNFFLHFFIYGM